MRCLLRSSPVLVLTLELAACGGATSGATSSGATSSGATSSGVASSGVASSGATSSGATSSGTTVTGSWIRANAPGQLWTALASDASGDHLIAGSSIAIPPNGIASGAWISVDGGQTWKNVNGAIAGPVATNSTGTVLAVADGTETSGAQLFISNNSGASWSTPTPTAGSGWSGLASDSTGLHLVAVAAHSGDIWTSSDSGATWTDQTSSGPAHGLNWVSVASDSSGTHLVADEGGGRVVGPGGTGDIWTSSDSGATWTDQTSSGPTHNLSWRSVASDATGTDLVAVGSGIWTSSDSGEIWTPQAANIGTYVWVSVASSADGSHLVAATMAPGEGFVSTSGDLWTSSDSGATWTNGTAGTAATGQPWSAVASDATGTHLFAAPSHGGIWMISL
jgi:hypothetical protein